MIAQLFSLLIIYLPINLFLKFGQEYAFVNGRLVDYLLGKLFVTDILAVLIVLLTFRWKSRQKPIEKLGLIWLVGWLIWQVYFSSTLASSIMAVRLVLFVLLAATLAVSRKILSKNLSWVVLLSLLIQLMIASYQFVYERPLLDYAFLGESRIENPVGIAKTTIAGVEQTLAYGSTAHPNILAGWFVLISCWWWQIFRKQIKNQWLKNNLSALLIIANCWVIFMTQSLAAAAGLVLAFSTYWLKWSKQKLIVFFAAAAIISSITFLLLPQSSSLSVSRRARLEQAAISLFLKSPLTGQGLRRFTSQLESVSSSDEIVRFIQPPHNIFWLWLAETGLLGVGAVWLMYRLLLKPWWKKTAPPATMIWLALMPLALLDHYLITSQTGLLTLVLVLTITKLPKSALE